ncbi:MAG: 1,4-alpha-glucan branching protein GlgB [Balneolaceae bacterium]
MRSTLLKIEEIAAISNGSHGDPFSILGLHQVSSEGSSAWVIRVFRPDARSVTVLPGRGKEQEMVRLSDEGLFEAPFPRHKKRFRYRLRVEPFEGTAYEIDDAYQYGKLLTDFDLQLWGEGNHHHTWKWMGAHIREVGSVEGTHFVVVAPGATRVSVIGPFNNWDGRVHGMRRHYDLGIWEIFIPHVGKGDLYKFEVHSGLPESPVKKADPYAFQAELRPGSASIVWKSHFEWNDRDWVENRTENQSVDKPVLVYELHPGSWRVNPDEKPGFLTWRELADQLIPYIQQTGYTHVELMAVAEHPYDPSWGYQITGYFAPTSRFGSPDDFKYFVDRCHHSEIGVLIDWVPAHFTKDEHGLRLFDGTALYEHSDPRQGEHRDWGTHIFNYGRTEVKNFLISNAVFWFDEFHVDGLRVDAVASMLYLDYSREDDDWVPNRHGGRENLEAIDLLKRFNEVVHGYFPGVLTMAEESTSWGGVTTPVYNGGLGFDYKWNMGWMNDTLEYMSKEPIHRKYHQDELTFSMIYAWSENFILPLSHDEVVHGKQSLLSKMPGDDWQKFSNLRLLYTYMYGHPGKKLLFMGGEFGQWHEWKEDRSIDWHLLQWDTHKGMQRLISDLNRICKSEPALYEMDHSPDGFQWIDASDADHSILSFVRRGADPEDTLVFVLNFTPSVHQDYRIGVPLQKNYRVILNSDSDWYGGSNVGPDVVAADGSGWHGQPAHIKLSIPPLAGLILKPV